TGAAILAGRILRLSFEPPRGGQGGVHRRPLCRSGRIGADEGRIAIGAAPLRRTRSAEPNLATPSAGSRRHDRRRRTDRRGLHRLDAVDLLANVPDGRPARTEIVALSPG